MRITTLNNKKYILSVLIPTFDRTISLERLLYELTSTLIKNNLSDIEIIISDNSSTIIRERNRTLVYKLNKIILSSSPCATIRYYENNTNIGYGRNLLVLYAMATGKYIWFISDGDILLSKGFLSVIKIIRQGDFEYYSIQFIVRYGNKKTTAQKTLTDFADRIFYLEHRLPFMYLSGSIHKKQVDFIEYKKCYENFTQIYIFVQNILSWSSHLQIDEIVFELDGQETRRFQSLETFLSEISIIDWLNSRIKNVDRLSLEEIKVCKSIAYRRLLWDLIAIKARHLKSDFSTTPYYDILYFFLSFPSIKAVILITFLFLPKTCCRMAYYLTISTIPKLNVFSNYIRRSLSWYYVSK